MMKGQWIDRIPDELVGRLKKCFSLVKGIRNQKILNIGCSFGWFESFLLRQNGLPRLTVGMDINEKALENAKKNIGEAFFIKSSALAIPFKTGTFDKITFFDVLEHLPKGYEVAALQEINRVLSAKGMLYLSTPHRSFLSNFLDPAWYLGHRHYCKERIEDVLTKAGFRLNRLELGGGLLELLYVNLFYFYKWVLKKEISCGRHWTTAIAREYLPGRGFATIFIQAEKISQGP